MKGLSYAALGQFYQAIKVNTKLRVLHMPEPGSTEQDRVLYIRGGCPQTARSNQAVTRLLCW